MTASLPDRSALTLAAALLALPLLGAGCDEDPIVEDPASGTAVWMSDVHFNPFYIADTSAVAADTARVRALLQALVDPTAEPRAWKDGATWGPIFDANADQGEAVSRRGVDANHRLFQTVLARARAQVAAPDFAVLTGDLLAHDFGSNYEAFAPDGFQTVEGYDAFVAETIRYVAASVRSAVPGEAPVFATLGNNDAYCGDYDIRQDSLGSDFLHDTADTFLEYFLPGLDAPAEAAFRSEFATGGVYAADLPRGNRILVINSVALIPAYPETWDSGHDFQSECGLKRAVDPATMLDWLEREAAEGGEAWVAMHVPPGQGCYDDAPYWTPDAERRVSALFQGRPAALAGGFAAHSHMTAFKLIGDGVVYQAPSIGTNHDNNATFSVLTYDPASLAVEGLRVHAFDPDDGAWSEFAFAGYEDGPPTASALAAFQQSLAADTTAWTAFVDSYGSGASVSLKQDSGRGLQQSDTSCLVAAP